MITSAFPPLAPVEGRETNNIISSTTSSQNHLAPPLTFPVDIKYDGIEPAKKMDLREAEQVVKQYFLNNFTETGQIRAAQTTHYHDHDWVRDSALAFENLLDLYANSTSQRVALADRIKLYVLSCKQKQTVAQARIKEMLAENPQLSEAEQIKIRGAAHFEIDDSFYKQGWGDPQHDGPALRSLGLIRLSHALAKLPQNDPLKTNFDALTYNTLQEVITEDLQYTLTVTSKLQTPEAHLFAGYDYWEMDKGQNFSSLLAERDALAAGKNYYLSANNEAKALECQQNIEKINRALERHYDKGFVKNCIDQQHGFNHERDVQVVLAALYNKNIDSSFSILDDRILQTAYHIEKDFKDLEDYYINRKSEYGGLGTAIGRYKEDQWDGDVATGGKPAGAWYIATLAYAELHYRLKDAISDKKQIEITERNYEFFNSVLGGQLHSSVKTVKNNNPLFDKILKGLETKGDGFLNRVIYHAGRAPDQFAMPEQFDRFQGYWQGPKHLTWSYGAFLNAVKYRERRSLSY